MKIGSLFSGIGGLELGLEWSGLGPTAWQVEQNDFCRGVLARHWPKAKRYTDVREVGGHNLAAVELVCGGFPCQDVSSAGKGKGLAGSRSGLWYQFARVLGELRPRWTVIENVTSGASRWVDDVVRGLEELGYESLPVPLSAADVGAPHRRARIFVIAHAVGEPIRHRPKRRPGRRQGAVQGAGQAVAAHDGEEGSATHAVGAGLEVGQVEHVRQERATAKRVGRGRASTNANVPQPAARPKHGSPRKPSPSSHGGWRWGPTVPPVCQLDDGVPARMARLSAFGNAVVPQCAEVIGHLIQEIDEQRGRSR